MSLKKIRLLYWAAAGLLALCILSGLVLNFFNRTWTADELDESTESQSVMPFAATDLADEGEAAISLSQWFDAGDYSAVLQYQNAGENGFVRVVSADAVNSENELGQTLAETVLDGDGEAYLQFFLHGADTDVYLVVPQGLQIESLMVRSTTLKYTDLVFFALLVLAAAFVGDRLFLAKPLALGEALQDRFVKRGPLLVLLGVCLFASYPLFANYVPFAHDIPFHTARIQYLADGFLDGQFPVRIAPSAAAGKGYASPMMYPDLFLWPFALLRVCGVSLATCYQSLCVCINVATAALMYLAARRLFSSRWAGVFAALLYTLAPYRLLNIYVRGAIGEVITMAFLPLVVWGFYEVFFGKQKRWPLLALGVTGILQSHILSIIMSAVFLVVAFVAFLWRLLREKTRILSLCKAVGFTVLLNLWFILPFLFFYGQDLEASGYDHPFYGDSVLLAQFFTNFGDADGWLILGKDTATQGALPLTIGLPLLLCGLALLGTLLLAKPKSKAQTRLRHVGAACLAFGAFALLLCSDVFPWFLAKVIPLVKDIFAGFTLPWRFMGFATLFLALCGGALAVLLLPQARRAKAFVFAAVFIPCFLIPAHFLDAKLQITPFYVWRDTPYVYHYYDHATLGVGEYYYNGTDGWELLARPNVIAAAEGQLRVSGYEKDGTRLSFDYETDKNTKLELPLAWYPGYVATDETGDALATEQAENGLMTVQVTAGAGHVAVRYAGLWWFRLGDAASLATAGAAVVIWLLKRRQPADGNGKPAQEEEKQVRPQK